MKQLMSWMLALLLTTAAWAQGDNVPQVVKDAFSAQYPGATVARYDDNALNVRVVFTQNGESMTAHYSKKGEWRYTEKLISFASLPEVVKDGFRKSKFANRMVEETSLIYRPSDVLQYRLKARKGKLQKKNLLFSAQGRLLDEDFSL